jgi:hypothetical protein
MNTAPAGSQIPKWTWMYWLSAIAIVFAGHLALLYIFGLRKPPAPLPVKNVPSLALATASSGDWLSLNDATLFALPDRNGFAGPMWAVPSLPYHPQPWDDQPNFLLLPAGELGSTFHNFVQTNHFAGAHFEFNQPPPLTGPVLPARLPLERTSTLQIQGEITKRPLLNPISLPIWHYADVIAPSIVQVLVDAAGHVVSAVLLPPENFLETSATRDPEADKSAVELAHAARFAPVKSADPSIASNPLSQLTVGRLIFNWQTVPVTATNVSQ